MKKLLVITVIVTVLVTTFIASYQAIRNAEPKQTGGNRLDIAPPEYYTELSAMEKLNSELPLSVDGITITFDYSQGKYVVTGDSGIDTASVFSSWHSADPYSMISIDRFIIK
ncbi:hypothetical protein KBD69_00495 [Candidatus Woesebacteria bacterium]|nr:hypothetical protein [Candidatus Woesebacteria bacterium]